MLGLLAVRASSPDPRIGDDDFGVFFAAAAAVAGQGSAYVGDFVSPPWFALALVPLTALPLPAARALWHGFNLALLLAATALASRLVGLAWPVRRVCLVGALTGLIPAVEFGLHLGQNSLLVWVLVLAALRLAADGRFAATGTLLALALLKPQLVWLFAIGVAALAWRQRRLRALLGAGALTLVVLAAASAVVAPDSYADLLSLRPRTWDYWGSTVALPSLSRLGERRAVAGCVALSARGAVRRSWRGATLGQAHASGPGLRGQPDGLRDACAGAIRV